MHLSRLTLRTVPACKRLAEDIGDPYQMHRTLLRAFPDKEDGGPGRVLWRLEPQGRNKAMAILIQSEKTPDWSTVEAIEGYLEKPAESTVYDPHLRQGRRLKFRLRANPTVKRPDDDGKPKRHGLFKREDQLAWLKRKADASGFALLDVRICRSTNQRGTKSIEGKKRAVTHFAVDFEGVLEVTDPKTFREALVAGIGPAKAFGCGLLSLARA